ncbi:MAG: 16S rRNA (guanine(966)-N(2))-methyltransferase RsmD [Candidatus Omnitrophica bacterium]|nr:16S rRNA (guanine(966)-N(2))-methyltransferase RsmD [Candidatus Omnitrophota bacterium]
MRIIAGRYKGRRMSMPKGIRPTMDKIREAIFNVLGTKVKGASVLDLFAGGGSFGIEAISRGALSAVLSDKHISSTKTIKKNLSLLEDMDAGKASVITKDAMGAIKSLHNRSKKFDIVFLDPPYHKGWVRKCLKYISIYDILSHSGWIIAEHSKKDKIFIEEEPLKLMRQLKYSDTIISIYNRGEQDD